MTKIEQNAQNRTKEQWGFVNWMIGGGLREGGTRSKAHSPLSRGRSAPLSCSDVGRRSVIAYRFGCLHISHHGMMREQRVKRAQAVLYHAPLNVEHSTDFPLLPYPMDTRADTTYAPSTSGEPTLPETAPYGMWAAAVTTFWPLLTIDNGRSGEISKRPVCGCAGRSLTANEGNVQR